MAGMAGIPPSVSSFKMALQSNLRAVPTLMQWVSLPAWISLTWKMSTFFEDPLHLLPHLGEEAMPQRSSGQTSTTYQQPSWGFAHPILTKFIQQTHHIRWFNRSSSFGWSLLGTVCWRLWAVLALKSCSVLWYLIVLITLFLPSDS